MDSDPDFHSVLTTPKENRKPSTRFPKISFFTSSNPDGFKRSKESSEKSFKEGLVIVAIICILATFFYNTIFHHYGGASLTGKSNVPDESNFIKTFSAN